MLSRSSLARHAGRLLLFTVFAWYGIHTLPASEPSNLTFRVMAANITSGNGQSYETAGINIFKGLKPDVVAIQEFRYIGGSSPAELRQLVDVAFGTNFNFYCEPGYGIPNGIVSRWPILDAGTWEDSFVADRGFAWARIDLPGTNELYVVSVHLYGSGSATDRNSEAGTLKTLVATNFPAGAWVVLGGDFNTSVRTEAAVTTFKTFLSDAPVPADNSGDQDTNEPRNKPYDYVLPSFSLANFLVPAALPSNTFTNGLVFDSAIYTPLTDVAPVTSGDSHVSGMQHMAVIKDFRIPVADSGPDTNPPAIVQQPHSQTVFLGANATFTVSANGAAPFGYRWLFNEQPLPNGLTSSCTVSNAQLLDAGGYSVVITNAFGAVTSSIAILTVNGAPVIHTQPQSVAVSVGSNATFSVSATGVLPLSYQWRFAQADIPGANASNYTRINVQPQYAGAYSVVITNSEGSTTSQVATLTLSSGASSDVIAQWNFNSAPPDGSTTTGSTAPSTGTGTATLTGGVTASFATGDTANDPAGSSDNSGWNTSTYPAQGTGNKTRGVLFQVSTAGKKNIVVTWSSQSSNTGSRYLRMQYAVDGINFVDYPVAATNGTSFTVKTNSLAAIGSVNNNSNFAFRLVSEFDSTANGTGTGNFVAASPSSSYATTGTVRFDMVSIYGETLPPSGPMLPPLLSSPALVNGLVQLQVSGSPGSNYVLQVSTNLASTNWAPILTNPAPFNFSESPTNAAPERFFRATVRP